jgi:hypothetical protein
MGAVSSQESKSYASCGNVVKPHLSHGPPAVHTPIEVWLSSAILIKGYACHFLIPYKPYSQGPSLTVGVDDKLNPQ